MCACENDVNEVMALGKKKANIEEGKNIEPKHRKKTMDWSNGTETFQPMKIYRYKKATCLYQSSYGIIISAAIVF